MNFGVTPNKDLRKQGPGRVNQDIAESGFPQGDEGLVPLVESRVAHSDQERNNGPRKSPAMAFRAYATEYGNAEDAELGYVSALANQNMQYAQSVERCRGKQPMKDRDKETLGLLSTEVVR